MLSLQQEMQGASKGDSDADVGTVFLAIATPDDVFAREFNFGNHRERLWGRLLINVWSWC